MIAATQVGKTKSIEEQDATFNGSNPKSPVYTDLASQAADSRLSCRNWKFNNADAHFPYDVDLRRVDRYFPYASGGPLLIDEPMTEKEEKNCEKKRKAIDKEGQRYAIITRDMELNEVLEQIKDIKREVCA